MKKLFNNKELILFIFLALFGFANGLFANYRDLWLSNNNLPTTSIANITSIASIITILIFLLFTFGVPLKKQKNVISITLILKMLTSTILIYLNAKHNLFLIKFFSFFDIAFSELILASIYPLILNYSKNDLAYTKKETIESLFSKIGFLVVSIFIGHYIGNYLFSYNTCLGLSVVFIFLAFLVFNNLKLEVKDSSDKLNINESFKYLKEHKLLYKYLICNSLGNVIYSSIMGMSLLTLTLNLGFKTQQASFIILSLGIFTNVLALIVIRYFKFKNDNLNMFIKFGTRIILYFLVFIFNNRLLYLITFLFLLVMDIPYGFLFGSYFLNLVSDKYVFFLTVLKYSSTLIGSSIGVFLCGHLFNLEYRYLVLPALLISIIHYILGLKIIHKRNQL